METKTITIFSDYVNVFRNYEEHLKNLYSLREIIGAKNFSLQADGTIQIMDYVGFFQKGNTRIQILPKIYAKTDLSEYSETELKASLYFVYRLLFWSGYLSHKKLSPQLQSASKSDLLEIFVQIFITEFIELFSRKIHREYIPYEENQQFIKGKILFSETIRRNPILKHLHYVRYDEYTINNPLNQIFKGLILELLKKTNDSDNKRKLAMGLAYLQEVDLINLNENLFKKIKFDRLNNDFEPLFNLAKLFFHNSQPGLSEGRERTFSFLVPVHMLFENFVAKVMDSFSTEDVVYNHHIPQIALATQNGNKVFPLKPDFTISRNKKVVTVLDTKFKYPFDNYGNVEINTSDLYQLVTYAVGYNCKNLFLIYPKFLGNNRERSLLSTFKINSPFGKITLQIIQVDVMNNNLEAISKELKTLVEPVLPTEETLDYDFLDNNLFRI